MGIPAVILPSIPTREVLVEYARKVNSLAMEAQKCNVQIWVKVHLSDDALSDFNLFHRLCDGIGNVGILLIMDPMPNMQTPAASVANQIIILHKAIGANLKAISFPTKVFLTNKRGYPTLAKSHQLLFTEALKRIGRTVRVLLEGHSVHNPTGGEENAMGATKCLPYLQYIRHIRERPEVKAVLDSEEAMLERAYLDSLQRPLQPLKDHLEFSMYETFEKDPVKYSRYQEAVFLALKDGLGSPSELNSSGSPRTVAIAVVGAGRGPLVMRCIRAFQQLQAPPEALSLKLFAVEKNPSAVVYLRSMTLHNPTWTNVVTVISEDSRKLLPAHMENCQIDIVVSELLGSFGDNELSPECLDPFLSGPCCKPSTISIPMQYTSFLAPISSVRLHTEAKQQAQVPHDGAQPLGIQRAMETTYVVRTHAASQTHAEQPCWVFSHPLRVHTKERAAHLEFAPDPTFASAAGCGYGGVDPAVAAIVGQAPMPSAGPITIHGLLGSFTAILYTRGDVVVDISIAPHRFSKDMFSWFPIYFPFHQPLQVPNQSNVSVSIWRKTQDERVWYEWYAKVHRKGEIIDSTAIHNVNGRSSHVSM
jgi:protein arginine N-methyltransferase 5